MTTLRLADGLLRHPLVRGAIWAVLLSFGGLGCLFPQNGTFLEEVPGAQNRPPRIVKAEPDRTKVNLKTGQQCKNEKFSILVEDPDLDDRLVVRWYVDFEPQSNPSPVGAEQPVDPDGSALRGRSVTLDLTPLGVGNPLLVPGVHTVEALVADGELVNRVPQFRDRPLDGGPGLEPTFVDTHAWTAVVVQEECP